jgi:hypothetical protein
VSSVLVRFIRFPAAVTVVCVAMQISEEDFEVFRLSLTDEEENDKTDSTIEACHRITPYVQRLPNEDGYIPSTYGPSCKSSSPAIGTTRPALVNYRAQRHSVSRESPQFDTPAFMAADSVGLSPHLAPVAPSRGYPIQYANRPLRRVSATTADCRHRRIGHRPCSRGHCRARANSCTIRPTNPQRHGNSQLTFRWRHFCNDRQASILADHLEKSIDWVLTLQR